MHFGPYVGTNPYDGYQYLDGYVLPAATQTLVGPWISVHSAPFVDFIVFFSSNSIAGTMTLEVSNDQININDGYGQICPVSALWRGTYGRGAFGDPLDLIQLAGTSLTISGNATPYHIASSVNSNAWVRVKLAITSTTSCTVNSNLSYHSIR